MTRSPFSRFWKNGFAVSIALAVLSWVSPPFPSGAETATPPRPPSKAFFEIPRTDSLAVFDFETRRIIRRIDLGSGAPLSEEGARETFAAPGGRYIYWSRHFGNDISVIDTIHYQVVGRIPLMEKEPGNVKVAPDGHALYIPHYQAKALTIFDLTDGTQRVIPLDGFPGNIAVTTRGDILVTSRNSNEVLVVDEVTGRIRAVKVGRTPVGIAVTHDGYQAYVSHDTEAIVAIINLRKEPFRVVKRLKVGFTGGSAVAAGPDGKYVYVAHCCQNSSISVISVDTRSVRCELPLGPKGQDPVRIVFSPGGEEAFIINSGSVNISSFRPPCGKPLTENLFDP